MGNTWIYTLFTVFFTHLVVISFILLILILLNSYLLQANSLSLTERVSVLRQLVILRWQSFFEDKFERRSSVAVHPASPGLVYLFP